MSEKNEQALEVTNEQDVSVNKKNVPIWVMAIPIVVLILSVSVNVFMLIKCPDESNVFTIYGVRPDVFLNTIIVLWTISIVSIPIIFVSIFYNNQKVPELCALSVSFLLLGGCIYLMAQDNIRLLGTYVDSFESTTDGTHHMIIKNCDNYVGGIDQHYYVQTDTFVYSKVGIYSKTSVEWMEDGAHIFIIDGNDICTYGWEYFK